MAAVGTYCGIPTQNPAIRSIFLMSISNRTVVCFAFKRGCEAAQRAAETVFCKDFWAHNTLIGYMPADNHYIQQRRCVCTLLPSDARPLMTKIFEELAKIDTAEKGELTLIPIIPVLNLFDAIQPLPQAAAKPQEGHGV